MVARPSGGQGLGALPSTDPDPKGRHVTSAGAAPSRWRHPARKDDPHGPHPARPAPHALLPPGRVVHAPHVRHGGRAPAGDGAQPAGAAHRHAARDVADPLEEARPDAEEPRRDGIGRLDRLLVVRGLRLLDRHRQGHRPGQAARGAAVAGQRRLHRPGAQGPRLRRGDDRHTARGDRRDGRRPAARAGRRGAGRADHDGGGGEHAVAVQQRPGPAQPGLLGPLRGPVDAGAGGPGPGRGVVTPGAGDLLAAFDRHRRPLFGGAYQTLGSVVDPDDTVQDAWLRWSPADRGEVADERAYLVTVVSRLALDRLRSARARRETYVGPWLPEPLLTGPGPEESAELGEQGSLAGLVVLETPSPVGRAGFVLREGFGVSWAEVAGALDRSEAAVRQLGHRAREHVQARRPRFDADRRAQEEVTERFLAACVGGDVDALMAVLAPGVVLLTDGGGRAKAALRPIVGAAKAARFLAAVSPGGLGRPGLSLRLADVNGTPGVVVGTDAGPAIAVSLVVAGGRVEQALVVLNPDKLAGIAAAAPGGRA